MPSATAMPETPSAVVSARVSEVFVTFMINLLINKLVSPKGMNDDDA